MYSNDTTDRVGRLPNGSVLLDAVSSALSSPRSDDAISEELFDLIGYDHIELVMEILQNRASVVQEVREHPCDVVLAINLWHSGTSLSRSASSPREWVLWRDIDGSVCS